MDEWGGGTLASTHWSNYLQITSICFLVFLYLKRHYLPLPQTLTCRLFFTLLMSEEHNVPFCNSWLVIKQNTGSLRLAVLFWKGMILSKPITVTCQLTLPRYRAKQNNHRQSPTPTRTEKMKLVPAGLSQSTETSPNGIVCYFSPILITLAHVRDSFIFAGAVQTQTRQEIMILQEFIERKTKQKKVIHCLQ